MAARQVGGEVAPAKHSGRCRQNLRTWGVPASTGKWGEEGEKGVPVRRDRPGGRTRAVPQGSSGMRRWAVKWLYYLLIILRFMSCCCLPADPLSRRPGSARSGATLVAKA